MDLATSTSKQLTQGQSDLLPTWSPDGKQIAFISLRDDNYGIYVMTADGSDPRPLTKTHLPGFYRWLSWSPDGKQLVFILDNDATCPHIFTIRSDGTDVRQLTYEPECDGPSLSWSPDSKQIVFTKQDGQIYILTLQSSDTHPLTLLKGMFCHNPTWSPDGTTIAFVLVDYDNSVESLYLIDANGANLRPLIHNQSDLQFDSIAW